MSKENHDHKITKNLKAILFAFLMFLPVLSVVSTSLYTIFNDNAYQSYDGKETYLQAELKTPTNAVNTLNDIKIGNYYLLTITKDSGITELFNDLADIDQIDFKFDFIGQEGAEIEISANYMYSFNYANITYPIKNNQQGYVEIYLESADGYTATISAWQQISLIVKIRNNSYIGAWQVFHELPKEYLQYTTIEKEIYTLNNAFDKAFNELENNKMYSWTKDTIIYQGVNNTLNLLQVKNNTLVVLITYWLYLTTIYIIIDIIIESIVFLTHMINVKADKN